MADEIENNNAMVIAEQAPPAAAEERRGRRRVEMKKMANKRNLQVTFSKRRSGVFKKASELCILCGVEMAVVVFSPGAAEKVYSFGHPSVDAVFDRYVDFGAGDDGGVARAEASAVEDLNATLSELRSEVEVERKRGWAMNRERREAVAAGRWWEAPAETIQDEAQLVQLAGALEVLKNAVKLQTDRIVAETTAAIEAMAGGPVYGYGGGGESSNGQPVPFNYNMNIDNNNNNNYYYYNNGVAHPYNNNNNNNNNGFF